MLLFPHAKKAFRLKMQLIRQEHDLFLSYVFL